MDHQEVESIVNDNLNIENKNQSDITSKVEEGSGDNTVLNEKESMKDDQIKNLESQLSSLQSKYLLMAADFENFKKRTFKKIEDIEKYSLEKIIRDILEVIDNIDRAIISISKINDKENNTLNSTLEGVIQIKKQFMKILGVYGVQKIDTSIGSEFDPNFHEAVQYVSEPKLKDGSIKDILLEGYMLHSRVLRPTSVIISKNESN